ncbi:MAG TPA: methylated-DNA--[protein]-cysteine S-methyltransferase [Acidimicrobiales bacterium]|jgi:methylated-DNA-[protein]-cysteine S-methyltransferase|nr:methylated-DNA--[protein]-cysteine S-methyltransferase [Acidimicrobiales bacterium]
MTTHTTIDSPIGPLLLTTDGTSLTGIYLDSERGASRPADLGDDDSDHPVLVAAADQLRAYFAGELDEFALPLAAVGTAFQKEVWDALAEIPYGETISYGELARRVGKPNASRAVGLANGRNPLPIIVPCHRVIGANGTLTGYGGGIERKQWLLEHEREHAGMTLPLGGGRGTR